MSLWTTPGWLKSPTTPLFSYVELRQRDSIDATSTSIHTGGNDPEQPPPAPRQCKALLLSFLAGVGVVALAWLVFVAELQLLTHQAPASSLYTSLRNDLKYLITDSWSGMTGQFLTACSVLYLAQETQRVAVIPSPWRDNEHYHNTRALMRDIYDMERFRNETGSLFVELDQVKPIDPDGFKTTTDELGCYHGTNWARLGVSSFIFSPSPVHADAARPEKNTLPDFHVNFSSWDVPRVRGWAENSLESFVLFDLDERYRLAETKRVAEEQKKPIPRNMQDSQLLCYDNIWALQRAAAMADGRDGRVGDYLFFDELQREHGGMYELLDPSMRGKHPEWFAVGRFIDFHPDIWDVALFAVRKTLSFTDIPRNLLTVHLRRGDFVTWCARKEDCVPQIETYKREVDDLLKTLPKDTIVLATTDDTSPDFLSDLTALGWFVIDHEQLGTASLLSARYGELASGWYDSAVDQAIHSLGAAFVGTGDSQVSLVGALRVATWNGGETRQVRRPGGWRG
ncbi:hypothetical protein JCM11641_003347 [Rhodosporidiobolus odoratus]